MKKITTPREMRGLVILSEPENIKKIKKNVWYVKSQSKEHAFYRVNRKQYGRGGFKYEWTCDCPDHVYRHQICKHIYAVQFSLELKEAIEKDAPRAEAPHVWHGITCPMCSSTTVLKYGLRKTRFGKTQRYRCGACNYTFVENQGFKHMKHDPKIITLALDLYFKGVSLRKIADHLKQFHEIEVAQTTPMRWIKKYLKLLAHYVEKNKVNTGKIWHSDEMTVFIKKEG
ncbi:MAG: hypothetical protein APR53_01795, partial [Methanoculleus sp. SDB]